MIGFLCRTKAKNDEEYKEQIKKNMKIFVLIGLIGAVSIIFTELAVNLMKVNLSSNMHSFYIGAETGIIFACIILWIKSRNLLHNKEKLVESRLNNSDERIYEIREKSFKAAAISILIILYGIAFIGGLFYPELIKIVLGILCIFFITYGISFKVYEKKI